jgi:diguanylate cyclase (GGDEF)-like protein/PAS domain S-box-containing protein
MLAELLGFENHADLFFHNVADFYVDPKDREKHIKELHRKPVYFEEFKLKQKTGAVIHVRDYPHAIYDEENRMAYIAGVLVDISEQKEAEQKLQKVLLELEESNRMRESVIQQLRVMSLVDELTGLYNRRGFFAAAREYIAGAAKKNQKVFLVFLDLDNLKRINDTWGHLEGDKALSGFASILKTGLRKSDIKGRLGGDEFAVLACEAPDVGVEVLIGRLRSRLLEVNQERKQNFEISVSIGVSVYDPAQPRSIDDLLARADADMYRHKPSKIKT